MKAKFETYIISDEWEQMESIWDNLDPSVQAKYNNDVDEFFAKVGRPFYEFTLNCELDTDTNKVTLLSVDGVGDNAGVPMGGYDDEDED